MATHKSAEKADRQARKRRTKNRSILAHTRNSVADLRTAIASKKGSKDALSKQLNEVQSLLMSTASKGVLKSKTVSRTIGRLSKAIAAK